MAEAIFRLNVEFVEELLLSRAWTVEELIAEVGRLAGGEDTGLSARTIRRGMKGKKLRLDSIRQIAKVLGQDHMRLIVRGESDAEEAPPDDDDNGEDSRGGGIAFKVTTASGTVSLEVDREDLFPPDELEAYIRALLRAINRPDEGFDVKQRKGSVILDITMSPEAVQDLLEAWKEGRLEGMNILNVRENGGEATTRTRSLTDPTWLNDGDVLDGTVVDIHVGADIATLQIIDNRPYTIGVRASRILDRDSDSLPQNVRVGDKVKIRVLTASRNGGIGKIDWVRLA